MNFGLKCLAMLMYNYANEYPDRARTGSLEIERQRYEMIICTGVVKAQPSRAQYLLSVASGTMVLNQR